MVLGRGRRTVASNNIGYAESSTRVGWRGHSEPRAYRRDVVLDRIQWGDAHVDLVVPMEVSLSWSDGEFVAMHEGSKVFGRGPTPSDALMDFNSAFLTAYRIVSKYGQGNFSWAPIMYHVRGYVAEQAR